jgi:cell division protein FtsQ
MPGSMKAKFTIRNEVKVSVAVLGLLSMIAFTERNQADHLCRDISIHLVNHQENHYLDEADVLHLLTKANPHIRGLAFDQINFKQIETRLEYDRHIHDAQAYKDLKGNLVVRVALRRPVARIVQADAPDAYVAHDGVIMGVADNYNSRVLLISGPFAARLAQAQNVQDVPGGDQLLRMIEYIRQDRFWNAQIAQVDIAAEGKIILFPQVTGQRVEFGRPDDFEEKLRKLMIFYKEILPQRGWTRYSRVNLEYDGQIIAE